MQSVEDSILGVSSSPGVGGWMRMMKLKHKGKQKMKNELNLIRRGRKKFKSDRNAGLFYSKKKLSSLINCGERLKSFPSSFVLFAFNDITAHSLKQFPVSH